LFVIGELCETYICKKIKANGQKGVKAAVRSTASELIS